VNWQAFAKTLVKNLNFMMKFMEENRLKFYAIPALL